MGNSQMQYPIITDDGAKILKCCDCQEEFIFTADAQKYLEKKGYTKNPKRCKSCYAKTKKQQRNGNADLQPPAS